MTKIRLTRTGSTHLPYYRVVVADSRSRRDGKFIEILGSYDPRRKSLDINQERATYWVSVGAQPTNTTISLLTKAGVEHPFQPRKKPTKAAKNPSETAAPAAAAPAESAAEAQEAPAEESAEDSAAQSADNAESAADES